MNLALFDLDNTLLAGDSDHAWGEFLAERGVVDGDSFRRANDNYYDQYLAGTLDIFEFLTHQLRPLAEHEPEQLLAWRAEFMRERVGAMMLPAARALVERHRRDGDTLIIITATNRFVTAPIAAAFGIEHLLATEPEQLDGRYTGRVSGIPCYREGKVRRLEAWLAEHNRNLRGSHFYSDSHNDLPLLERVDHPVAVNPDPTLARHARERGWPTLNLRA